MRGQAPTNDGGIGGKALCLVELYIFGYSPQPKQLPPAVPLDRWGRGEGVLETDKEQFSDEALLRFINITCKN